MNKRLSIALVVLVSAVLAMSSTVTADLKPSDISANKTAKNNISVSVASNIMLDVKPDTLSYTKLTDYGQDVRVGEQIVKSDNGFEAIEIENIGSENIDSIWLNASVPTTNPFGSNTASSYDAGNFLQVKPSNRTGLLTGDSGTYHFINRREYAWTSNLSGTSGSHLEASVTDTDVPAYIHEEDTTADGTWAGVYNTSSTSSFQADFVEYGRYRAGDEWYVWAMPHTSDALCDGSGQASFLLGQTEYNQSSTGTVDFTADGPDNGPVDYKIYDIQTNSDVTDYGYVQDVNISVNNDDTGGEEMLTYDVLTTCGSSTETYQPHVFFNKYNVNALGDNDLTTGSSATKFIMPFSNTPTNQLPPGESVSVFTAIQVPFGVVNGKVDDGKLRVLITSDKDVHT